MKIEQFRTILATGIFAGRRIKDKPNTKDWRDHRITVLLDIAEITYSVHTRTSSSPRTTTNIIPTNHNLSDNFFQKITADLRIDDLSEEEYQNIVNAILDRKAIQFEREKYRYSLVEVIKGNRRHTVQ
jgi:hypothetical protein